MQQLLSVAPGTRRLSEVARHVVRPSTMVDSAWFDLDRTFVKLGITFDAWQDGAGQLILGTDITGGYSCTVGGACLSLPRQVGKTYLIGSLVFALCVRFPRLLVIWTAHHADTAAETFAAMEAMSRRQKVAPHVRKTYASDNHKEVVFRNGSRILFGARARGFGRGIPGVDVLVCDEAQILGERAMDDMLATLNTAKNGLPIFLGTPPTPVDQSDAFRRMRDDALSGESDDLVWIECGADSNADPDDRDQWAKANPSYPHRTPLTSMLRLRKKLTPESWMREGLGIWDEDASSAFAESWPGGSIDGAPPVPVGVLAVASGVDLTHSVIVAAALQGDLVHVKPLQYGPGTAWVVDEVSRLSKAYRVPVVIDGRGPASAMIPDLEDAVSDLRVMSTEDVVNASAGFWELVVSDRVRHGKYPELDAAVKGAVKRPVGDRWAWGRRKSAVDVSPLEAATLAAWEIAHPSDGPNIFTSETREMTVVCGPGAEAWVNQQAAPADVVVAHADFVTDAHPGAAWVIWDTPGAAQAWRRDRFRLANPDVRIVIVTDDFETYRPSKYHDEELVTIGGA